jgi:adiponectin receptor
MGATYIGGAILFALRAPECFAPGRFDYFFASHQLFHVCVIVAAGFHYQAVANLYAWRQATACPVGTLTLF